MSGQNSDGLVDCESELHETASLEIGLRDFGDASYRGGLLVLLEAYDMDLRLTDFGRQSLRARILDHLKGRLYAQKGWIEHANVSAIPIQRPLVILGLPRSGTTALHRLLSVDPQFQGLETWLIRRPMVRPPRETWEMQPEYRACVNQLESFYAGVPERRTIHEFVAGAVEECIPLLLQTFASTIWFHFDHLPTYENWLQTQDLSQSYRYLANVLRLIGSREPEKRWLLKNPFHMAEIEALLKVFPDACIVHTHRDPLQTIPSFCDNIEAFRPPSKYVVGQGKVDGARLCAYWRKALYRAKTSCQTISEQVFHLDYRRFVADPLGAADSIYSHFGFTLSPDTEQRMHAWLSANPQSKHGRHKYTSDCWGISPAEICAAFAEYRTEHQFD